MLVVKEVIGHFKTLMDQSFFLRIVFWSLALCFISTLLLMIIISPYFDCNIFATTKTCAQSLPYNTNECSTNNEDYCCGSYGSSACDAFKSCLIKPTPFNTPRCTWFLLTTWIFEGLSVVLTIPFVILVHKVQNKYTSIPSSNKMANNVVFTGN